MSTGATTHVISDGAAVKIGSMAGSSYSTPSLGNVDPNPASSKYSGGFTPSHATEMEKLRRLVEAMRMDNQAMLSCLGEKALGLKHLQEQLVAKEEEQVHVAHSITLQAKQEQLDMLERVMEQTQSVGGSVTSGSVAGISPGRTPLRSITAASPIVPRNIETSMREDHPSERTPQLRIFSPSASVFSPMVPTPPSPSVQLSPESPIGSQYSDHPRGSSPASSVGGDLQSLHLQLSSLREELCGEISKLQADQPTSQKGGSYTPFRLMEGPCFSPMRGAWTPLPSRRPGGMEGRALGRPPQSQSTPNGPQSTPHGPQSTPHGPQFAPNGEGDIVKVATMWCIATSVWAARMASLESQVEDRGRRVAALESRAEDREGQIAALESRAENRERQMAALESQAEDCERQMASLETAVLSKGFELVQAEDQERQVGALRSQAENRERQMAALHAELAAACEELAASQADKYRLQGALESTRKTEAPEVETAGGTAGPKGGQRREPIGGSDRKGKVAGSVGECLGTRTCLADSSRASPAVWSLSSPSPSDDGSRPDPTSLPPPFVEQRDLVSEDTAAAAIKETMEEMSAVDDNRSAYPKVESVSRDAEDMPTSEVATSASIDDVGSKGAEGSTVEDRSAAASVHDDVAAGAESTMSDSISLPIAEDGSEEITADGSIKIVEDGSVEIAEDGSVEIAEDGSVEIAKDGSVEIAEDGSIDIAEAGSIEIAKDGSLADLSSPAVVSQSMYKSLSSEFDSSSAWIGYASPPGTPSTTGAKGLDPEGLASPPPFSRMAGMGDGMEGGVPPATPGTMAAILHLRSRSAISAVLTEESAMWDTERERMLVERERAERQLMDLKEEARILTQLLYKERSLAARMEKEVPLYREGPADIIYNSFVAIPSYLGIGSH